MEILFVSIGELLLWGGCNLTLYKKGHWTEGQAAGHFHLKDAIKRPRGSSPSSPLANKIFSSLIYDFFFQNSLVRKVPDSFLLEHKWLVWGLGRTSV